MLTLSAACSDAAWLSRSLLRSRCSALAPSAWAAIAVAWWSVQGQIASRQACAPETSVPSEQDSVSTGCARLLREDMAVSSYCTTGVRTPVVRTAYCSSDCVDAPSLSMLEHVPIAAHKTSRNRSVPTPIGHHARGCRYCSRVRDPYASWAPVGTLACATLMCIRNKCAPTNNATCQALSSAGTFAGAARLRCGVHTVVQRPQT